MEAMEKKSEKNVLPRAIELTHTITDAHEINFSRQWHKNVIRHKIEAFYKTNSSLNMVQDFFMERQRYYYCLPWLQEGVSAGSVIYGPQALAAHKSKLHNYNVAIPLQPIKIRASTWKILHGVSCKLHDINCFTKFRNSSSIAQLTGK